jgi:hypothetical protein
MSRDVSSCQAFSDFRLQNFLCLEIKNLSVNATDSQEVVMQSLSPSPQRQLFACSLYRLHFRDFGNFLCSSLGFSFVPKDIGAFPNGEIGFQKKNPCAGEFGKDSRGMKRFQFSRTKGDFLRAPLFRRWLREATFCEPQADLQSTERLEFRSHFDRIVCVSKFSIEKNRRILFSRFDAGITFNIESCTPLFSQDVSEKCSNF